MSELFIFLVKANISLLLFCAVYYFLLRRLTFYILNRFFLLAGILFSSVYPFIDFSVFLKREPIIISVDKLTPLIGVVVEQVRTLNFEDILSALFWVGVLFMILRLFVKFLSLYGLHRKSVRGYVNNFPVRILNQNVGPFSFGKNIYINPQMHSKYELNAILDHEKIHVRQWHTIDILFAELNVVLHWFNPGVWLMRKAVKENIEFITDRQVLKKGADRKLYQYSILSCVNKDQKFVLTNHFNLINIKRRIIMMNKKRSSEFHLVRYMFIVPVVLLVTLTFNVVKATIYSPDPVMEQDLVKDVFPHKYEDLFMSSLNKKDEVFNKQVEENSISANPPTSSKTFEHSVKAQDSVLNLSEMAENESHFAYVSDKAGKPIMPTVKLTFYEEEKLVKAVINRPSESFQFRNAEKTIFFIDGQPASVEKIDALKSSEVYDVQMKKGVAEGSMEIHVYTKR